jgi:outer membrane lipoprotein-sorting protein
MMLKNGNDMWFYDPYSKASVRISPQQRLLGQAANGDVITVNFARDYRPALAGEERIRDGNQQERNCFKLNLAAVSPDVTYDRIEMWVDSEAYSPVKGRFYSESGTLLKTVYYRRYRNELGVERPTEIVIVDGLNPRWVTVMRYGNYRFRDIPDAWYQRDYLPRFAEE